MKYLLVFLIILPVVMLQAIGNADVLQTHLILQTCCCVVGNFISGFLMALGVLYLYEFIRGNL